MTGRELAPSYLLFISLQEEDRKKREELEAIMAENNRKMEEAQRKLVRTCFVFLCLYSNKVT